MNICEQLSSIRPEGKVLSKVFHGSQILSLKTTLKREGYYALSDEFWEQISEAEATKLISESICYHLDSGDKLLEEEKVLPLVAEYFKMLPSNCTLKTNNKSGFECVSHSSLDVAVIAELNGIVGLICIEDNESP